ncbi:MAG: ABC transporter ATP-binding protein [Gemmatimonadetes bacterium]|nr:ABC transporter ATP-binding protein [Gemmatimonadota bacterium]MCC6774367.1 ABC transporter ATP-binding protein [Gemmatimonadaceae bacterium]
MITFHAVRVRYPGADADALAGVSFGAESGRLTAVVGPNGSGKSTLVRALLGRVPLAGGRVSVGTDAVNDLPRRSLAQRVAVVSQREDPAFPLAVRDYVALGRYPWQAAWGTPSGDDRAAVARALADAAVSSLTERRTDTLSGGEWQRVRVARALAQGTAAIVLDEPTTFLDIAHEMACFELLSALAHAGRCVLVVSHQLNLVARFADRVVLLSRGQVVADGPPDHVMRGETLERVYEWPLVVSRDPAVGAPTLVPLRKRHTPFP